MAKEKMNFIIRTEVEGDYKSVHRCFDNKLFFALKPPWMKFNLISFDGCNLGDVVELEAKFLFIKQYWLAEIIEAKESNDEIYFVDTGLKTPFPIKHWTHKHRIIKQSKSSVIIDDITFKTSNFIFDMILYPVIYIQFYWRKHIYKNYFKAKDGHNL